MSLFIPSYPVVSASGVVTTAEKWFDVTAADISSQNQGGLIWEMVTPYLRTGDNALELYVDCPFAPGSKISSIRAEYQGENANDGITLALVKRASLAVAWTKVNPVEPESNWTGASQAVVSYTYSPETLVAGTVYAIRIISIVAVTGSRLFRVGFLSPQRDL